MCEKNIYLTSFERKYWKIWVRENPFSGMFYIVMKVMHHHKGVFSTEYSSDC